MELKMELKLFNIVAAFVHLSHLFLFLSITNLSLTDSSEQGGDTPGMASDHNSGTAWFQSCTDDMVSMNMYKVYEKYNKDPHRYQDNNTVRSFRSAPVYSNNKVLFQFNLTSIPESEVILSATVHFLEQRLCPRVWGCRRSRGPSCRMPHVHPATPTQLILKGMSPNAVLPSYLGNVTFALQRKGPWQMRDVSSIISEARTRNELLILAEYEFDEQSQRRHDRISFNSLPYILVHTKDLTISEPNSVSLSLQRYSPFPIGEEKGSRLPKDSPSSRFKREADHLQNNYLPDFQYYDLKDRELWKNTYSASKPKSLPKGHGERQSQERREGARKSQELSFDKRTMKKARRRQWSEPRACARRYLRVDFADIGWSEWVLAPKAFDAYYCAGTCGFPIPKVVHPSNHATIQSIVRAVGIVPGVPEPCCIPDQMSPLAVLFLDSSRNMVLKVYPSMSVDTCACR